jgi:hypothetical protein
MPYNPPSGNITSSIDLFNWINSAVSNWFFTGIVIAAYFIMVIKMMSNTQNNAQAFVAASFICMILTVLLRVADLVSNWFMIIFIILTAIGAVWMHTENAKFG